MTAPAPGFPAFSSQTLRLLLPSATIRAIEKKHLAAGANLMERAGLAAANVARAMLRDAPNHPARVLVLAGPGNNGGDAFEAAVHLKRAGFDVGAWFATDPAQLPEQARAAHRKWRDAGGACSAALPTLDNVDLVIDGLFGIGLKRALGEPFSDLIERLNQAHARHALAVLALDVPSGIDVDTGRIMGCAIRATRTLTFITDKPGLHTLSGPDYAGEIAVANLELRFDTPADAGRLAARDDFAALLAVRQRDTHKGSFGTLGIFGGAKGMTGAALLAGRAAIKLGAGKVLIGVLDDQNVDCDPLQPELMLRPAASLLKEILSAAVAGPGLGTGEAARALLSRVLSLDIPLVLDADALNLTGADQSFAKAVSARTSPTIMTPHPLEAARLLGVSTAEVQHDRIAAAKQIALQYRAAVVLKGAGSVIAAPAPGENSGAWWINPTGNPGMASAGMGDVLAGIAGAFFSQHYLPKSVGTSQPSGIDWLKPLVAAVFLHGAAADALVARGIGPVGLTASELIDQARALWNIWHQPRL